MNMQEHDKYIQEVLDHMLEGCQIIDFDWRYLYLNDVVIKHARQARGELLGRRMMEVYPGIDQTPLFDSLKECMQSRTSKKLLNEFVYPDGSLAWFELTIKPVNEGLLITSLDITDYPNAQERVRKLNTELEQRVQERTAELSDLYNHAPCGYHSLDGDGLFVRINDTELGWLGYSREEIIGKLKFADLLTPASVQSFSENFPTFKARGWIRDLEFDMVRKDGSILPVLLSATAITDQQGRYLVSRSMITDLTDRKRAEQAIRKSQAQLEAANKELEAFAYSVSHDLRAPLRAIDGFSRILAEEYQDRLDAEGLRLLAVVRTNTQKMDQLITDLLDLSRLTRNQMQFSRIDMTALASTIYQEIAVPETQQKFAFSVKSLPNAYGDAMLMRQVWSNLIANAIKYTLPSDKRIIEVGGYRESDTNVYYVKDSGVGFNQEYTHKLFGVFQRLHSADEFDGTGVGLAIVQRIIHRHGGSVWAEGQNNQGATFYFSLPSMEPEHEPAK
jgi:PAS domain S-box-containing protein